MFKIFGTYICWINIQNATLEVSGAVRQLWLTLECLKVKKGKWSRYRPGVAQRVGRVIAVLFHDRGIRRGWVVSSMPRPHFTPRKDPVPIVQEAGWATGPVWTGGDPTGIRSRTVQPVVSHYTDWATGPIIICICNYLIKRCVRPCNYIYIYYIVC